MSMDLPMTGQWIHGLTTKESLCVDLEQVFDFDAHRMFKNSKQDAKPPGAVCHIVRKF